MRYSNRVLAETYNKLIAPSNQDYWSGTNFMEHLERLFPLTYKDEAKRRLFTDWIYEKKMLPMGIDDIDHYFEKYLVEREFDVLSYDYPIGAFDAYSQRRAKLQKKAIRYVMNSLHKEFTNWLEIYKQIQSGLNKDNPGMPTEF